MYYMYCTLLHVLEETSLRECLCFKVLAIDVGLKIKPLLQNCIIVLDFNVFISQIFPFRCSGPPHLQTVGPWKH